MVSLHMTGTVIATVFEQERHHSDQDRTAHADRDGHHLRACPGDIHRRMAALRGPSPTQWQVETVAGRSAACGGRWSCFHTPDATQKSLTPQLRTGHLISGYKQRHILGDQYGLAFNAANCIDGFHTSSNSKKRIAARAEEEVENEKSASRRPNRSPLRFGVTSSFRLSLGELSNALQQNRTKSSRILQSPQARGSLQRSQYRRRINSRQALSDL
jgi:hypothetical protein